jgi:hypothetical protein
MPEIKEIATDLEEAFDIAAGRTARLPERRHLEALVRELRTYEDFVEKFENLLHEFLLKGGEL